jgi:hypothetical protein
MKKRILQNILQVKLIDELNDIAVLPSGKKRLV